MTTTDLRVAEADWQALRQHFRSSFRSGRPPETGAIGVLGECRTSHRHEFTLARVFHPGPGDLKLARNGALTFASSYMRRAHLEMREKGLAGLVTFHTHPGADQEVAFSQFDDEQDPGLIENLTELEPATRLVSVVVGKSSQLGRLWINRGSCEPMSRLMVVGESLQYLPLTGRAEAAAPPPAAIFDSALAVTGAGAMSRLAAMKIAVVGASGTGSLVVELLMRAGCKEILVIDDDLVELRNLNRILYASQRAAQRREFKVDLLKDGIERIGLGCRVEALNGSVLDREVLSRLREADVIFGCVDKAYPRALLCDFAFRYVRPYIDIGTEIGADKQGIVSLDARTSYVAPGRYCLICSGVVTPRQLTFESLSYEERQRKIAQGYSDDLLLEQPAVMDLNMRSASFGVMVLRHLLQPFLLRPLPVAIKENLVTYTTLPIMQPASPSPTCRICHVNPRVGYGDNAPAIGLERSAVERILGPRGGAAA